MGQRGRGRGDLRARRLRQSERAGPGLPQPAAVDHPQDPAHGRWRSRVRRLFSFFQARPAGDVDGVARGGELDRQRAIAGLAERHAGRRRHRAALPHGAGSQADPPRLSGRPDRARAFAVRAGAHHRRALPGGSRPVADGRGAPRHRQDLRAELRARFFLFAGRPVARPHQYRDAHGGRQTTRAAGLSADPAHAGGTHDPEPSRPSGIRLAQAAAISRGAAAALPGRHGFEDGSHAGADRKRPPGGGLFHHFQCGAGAARTEDGPVLEPAAGAGCRASRGGSEAARGGARQTECGTGAAGAPPFAPKPDSPFAAKLRQAVQPAAPDQEK